MKNRKYPVSLFVFGFVTNMIFRFFWLFVPAIIMLAVGIFLKPCLYIGLGLLISDAVVSLIEQLKIRSTLLKDSDNEGFSEFQSVFEKEGNWRKNIAEYVEEKAVKVDYNSENDNDVKENRE